MKKAELRKQIGKKIRMIRYQHVNGSGRTMTQSGFADLLNETEPLDIIIDAAAIGQYERGDVAIPGDKLEKIYSLKKV